CFGPDEGPWQHAEHLGGLFVVVLATLALLRLRAPIVDKTFHFVFLIGARQFLPVAFQHTLQITSGCLGYPLFHRRIRLAVYIEVKPAGVVRGIRGEFSLYRLLDKIPGVLPSRGATK